MVKGDSTMRSLLESKPWMHAAFARLEAGVCHNRQVQLKARGHAFKACVSSPAIYGAAAWNFRDAHLSKLDRTAATISYPCGC